jgi:tripartite-type tricarboxylate transporter receptor subunit TctC
MRRLILAFHKRFSGSTSVRSPLEDCLKELAVLAATTLLACASALAQQYPSKPLKLIMSFPAGGPTDIVGRLIGQKLTDAWGQNVVIDNRPGGGGMIGGALAAKSPADGYTLFLGGISTLAIAPFVQKNMPFDPVRDFQPVSLTTLQPLLLMTHPSVPVKTVKEFVALARSRPGQINYASSGPGGSGHLAGELFKSMTQTSLVHIPYRGVPPALIDLMSGQVQTMFGTILASVPHIRTGKLRAIAITGPRRSVAITEVPTFAESGMPGFDASSWNGIVVPAGTPRPVVDKLNAEIVRIMQMPAVLERLSPDGTLALNSTPEEFAAYIKSEQAKWSKVVRAANITIN